VARPPKGAGHVVFQVSIMPISVRLMCLLGVTLASTLAQATDPSEPVAVAGNQVVSRSEMLAALRNQLRQLEIQTYELKRKALDEMINEKLLEMEARTQGVSAEELVRREADSKLSPVTETELMAYYFGQAERLNLPFDEVKEQLEHTLQQIKLQQERQAFVRRLREKYPVTILIRPPTTSIPLDTSRAKGKADAPVTLVEFSDFQCGFCRNASTTVKEIAQKYSSDVRVIFRDFPLRTMHPQAWMAAEASRCAADQGKFWEYHDLLFANQNNLDRIGLLTQASKLNLDQKAFETCLDSRKHNTDVARDVKDGTDAGLTGTPGFFVNGVFLNGALPAAAFEKAVEDELSYIRYRNACRTGDNSCQVAAPPGEKALKNL
jgi:protein-disulfide isomerase